MGYGKLALQLPLGETAAFDLADQEIILGRDPDTGIQIADPLLSQHHVRIFVDEEGVWLEDLGSTNGTFVNGVRLTPYQPVRLQGNARIELGDTTAQFTLLSSLGTMKTLVTQPAPKSEVETKTLVTQAEPTTFPWRRLAAGLGVLALIALLALGAAWLWPRGSNESDVATPEAVVQTATETPVSEQASVPSCRQPVMPIIAGGQSAAQLGDAVPFLDLPFPYDGSNENFGGTMADFRRAVQRSTAGGRINSFFDHLYPIYPALANPALTFGREPTESPIGGSVLLFDGQLSRFDNYSGHPAYDFSTYVPRQPSTPVFAAADGVVTDAGKHASGALYVKLEHQVAGAGRFLTIYWHLNPDAFFEEMKGRVGQPVTAGTRIGTMGNTGWSTGHHLHFEVRFDRDGNGLYAADEAVDPFGFIPGLDYPGDPWAQAINFTDARGDPYNHNASVSRYLWLHPLGVAAQVPSEGGGQAGQDGGQGGTLCAPPGAFPPGGTVYWSWAPDPPFAHVLVGTGNGCVLSATDAEGKMATSFDPAVRVEVLFDAAEFPQVNPDTLAIYWQDAGSEVWYPLPTQLDAARGIAAAETSRPGHCALMGRPARDVVPPSTRIEVSGERGVDGVWYDQVTVSASSSDPSGIAQIDYSLDAGTTWQLYTGPFTIHSEGVPQPMSEELVEDFGSGPGSFLMLFSATDNAGNVEDPPAYRRIVIDPSKAPPDGTHTPAATHTATPAGTPTASPTSCVPTVTAAINAYVRWGPGLIYDPPVATLEAGESAPILGRASDGSWWQIELERSGPANAQLWVADSVVTISCGADTVPVVATPVPPTLTPTPTSSPTLTPTATLTTTLTPTPTSDRFAPRVVVSHSPEPLLETNTVIITATARDTSPIARIEIWVQSPTDSQPLLVQTCLDTAVCTFQGGPYQPGQLWYLAYAWDPSDNQGTTGLISVIILSVPQ